MLIEKMIDFMRRESERHRADKQFDRTAERIIAELKSPSN